MIIIVISGTPLYGQPLNKDTLYALLTYGNMPVQPRFRVKFLLKFKYENVVRLAFQKKFYSKTRMDGHITIREKSVLLTVFLVPDPYIFF